MKFYFTAVVLVIISLLNCTERNRNNPFDPAGNTRSPIQLFISPDAHLVVLNWNIQDISDFTGFRLYRAKDDNNFNLLKELPSTARTYTDTLQEFYHWYQYRMTIQGYLNESPPSNAVKLFPGPGKIWILSRYGYSIRKISYDLLHPIQVFNTNYPPINWSLNLPQGEIWLAHAQYRYISKLNILLGYEDFFLQNNFRQPIDIKADEYSNRICLLDPPSRKIYFIQTQTIEDSILLEQDNYFKLLISKNSEIMVINENSTRIFSSDGDSLTTIHFASGFSGKDIQIEDNKIYILLSSAQLNQSRIIIHDLLNLQSAQITCNGYFNLLAKPRVQSHFFLSEILPAGTSRLVKLSEQGNRLLELPVLKGNIDDIAINQYDQSLVIVQRYENNLMLYDSSGQIISANNQFYDPIKIAIE